MLRAMVLVLSGLACFSSVAKGDDVLTCVVLQYEEPDETGMAMFLVDYCPVSGGVADCYSCVPDFEVFDVNSVMAPEFCPECFSVPSRRVATSDRPLQRRIGATQALVDYLPGPTSRVNRRRPGAATGRVNQVVSRDVQIKSPMNGTVVSVRLFDATLVNSKGRSRTVRFGLESDRPVKSGVRTIPGETRADAAYQLVINEGGRRYAVKTRTAVRDSGLAVTR
ncbi:MAG TPA: hypothetical protein VM510_05660 [Caulifigura sp.]|jgi:hypothetical protein|nr:hypothetical protein [Caulifigura sp.]